MTRLYTFGLDRPGLEDIRFLVERPALPGNGDLESAFLDGVHDLALQPATQSCAQALAAAAARSRLVVVIRNPALVLDPDLPRRIARAIAALPQDGTWSVAGAGGLGVHDQRHLALYASQMPAIPIATGRRPLLDIMPDLYVVDARFARTALGHGCDLPDPALETMLAVDGYLAGRAALFLPGLTAGIDGELRARDVARLADQLRRRYGQTLAGQTIPTLSGDIWTEKPAGPEPAPAMALDQAVKDAISVMAPGFSLSIVVRTEFRRAHLLERLLASISRARVPDIELEVILSTDADAAAAEAETERLTAAFRNLAIRLQLNDAALHSRVDNLLGGVGAATGDYVAFIDDDDYLDLFAFDHIRTACFGGRRPVIAVATELHAEEWQSTPSGRWVLASSRPQDRHPASGWREMFGGVNRLPICGLILPRDRLAARLLQHDLVHDLSEDYALFLLALTDPELPEILEIPETFCHVSIRGQENSVTMPDRRPWVRDIAAHLADLTANPAVAGPGIWQLLAGAGPAAAPAQAAIADLRRALDRARAELGLARRENRRLRAEALGSMETAA